MLHLNTRKSNMQEEKAKPKLLCAEGLFYALQFS